MSVIWETRSGIPTLEKDRSDKSEREQHRRTIHLNRCSDVSTLRRPGEPATAALDHLTGTDGDSSGAAEPPPEPSVSRHTSRKRTGLLVPDCFPNSLSLPFRNARSPLPRVADLSGLISGSSPFQEEVASSMVRWPTSPEMNDPGVLQHRPA